MERSVGCVCLTGHATQVAEHGGKPVAMKVSSIDRPGLFEQFWRMGLSRNLKEWEDAMRMQQLPIFNTCYADKDGHIMSVRFAWLSVLSGRPSSFRLDRSE